MNTKGDAVMSPIYAAGAVAVLGLLAPRSAVVKRVAQGQPVRCRAFRQRQFPQPDAGRRSHGSPERAERSGTDRARVLGRRPNVPHSLHAHRARRLVLHDGLQRSRVSTRSRASSRRAPRSRRGHSRRARRPPGAAPALGVRSGLFRAVRKARTDCRISRRCARWTPPSSTPSATDGWSTSGCSSRTPSPRSSIRTPTASSNTSSPATRRSPT